MIGRIRKRITSAHVLAGAALFVALGGTAVAATFGKDSVKSRHVADNKLKTKDLKDGKGVKSEDVIDGSIATGDLTVEVQGASGKVDAPGALVNGENVTGVARPEAGVYCITPAAGIDPATSIVVVSSDNEQNGTSLANDSHSVVEWDSQADACPPGTFEVNTFVYDGDDVDDDGGAADSPGDDLTPNNEAFSFVIS